MCIDKQKLAFTLGLGLSSTLYTSRQNWTFKQVHAEELPYLIETQSAQPIGLSLEGQNQA